MFARSAPSAPSSSRPIFQTYLLPSLPFRRPRLSLRRRRKPSTDTTDSQNSISTSTTAPTSYDETTPNGGILSGHASTISCSKCHADLALTSQIISKGFTGRHGRAYLVSTASSSVTSRAGGILPNMQGHKPVARNLVTGMHTVSDVSCAICGSVLGWKYLAAEDEGQRYKVGKVILESRRTVVGTHWELDGGADFDDGEEEDDGEDGEDGGDVWGTSAGFWGIDGVGGGLGVEEEEALFDSQDEDECEDLFVGVWSPALAKRRRARKIVGVR